MGADGSTGGGGDQAGADGGGDDGRGVAEPALAWRASATSSKLVSMIRKIAMKSSSTTRV